MNQAVSTSTPAGRGGVKITLIVGAAICLTLMPGVGSESGGKASGTAPRSILSNKADYHGPEREEPDPQNVDEIRIGFFAPHDAGNVVGMNLWRGATLAVEKANAAGGYNGTAFRLACRWADNPWGAGSKEMTRLVYEDKVWAVIGSVDGASTHIAEQVATKARITLVSPVSGDPGLTHTAVPWMFRMPSDDSAVAETLVRIAVEKRGFRRTIVLTSGDHEGRTGALEIMRSLGRCRAAPVLHLTFEPGQTDFSQQVDRISSVSAEGMILWGLSEPCSRLLIALRARGIELPVFGPAVFSLPHFLEKAGEAAEGLTTCRLAWERDCVRWDAFVEEFRSRFGEKPADDAALGYDAANIVVEAIRKAGLNRARVRDAVADMSGFAGIAGAIRWDNGGGNLAAPQPAFVLKGAVCEVKE